MRIIIHSLLFQFLCYSFRASTAHQNGLESIMRLYKSKENSENIRRAKGAEINRYIKEKIQPCEDFYEYTCGNWAKYHENVTANMTISPETLLHEQINRNLLQLLNENVTLRDNHAIRKVKIFYKSCVAAATDSDDIKYQVFLSNFIKNNGGFPGITGIRGLTKWWSSHEAEKYDWQLVVALMRYRYGFDILVSLDIDINYQNIYENSIYLTEPISLIPKYACSIKRSRDYKRSADDIFANIEMEVRKNLKLWLNMEEQQARLLSDSILQFDYELCSAREDVEKYHNTLKPIPPLQQYARETLKTFNNRFNNTLDFHRIVTESYGVPIYKPVFMRTPRYYEELINIINNYNATVIANYIMYRALAQINFPSNDNATTRPFNCLNIIKKYFPRILGEMYFQTYVSTFVKTNEVHYIYEKLREIFHWKLQQQNWILESTRRLGQHKLNKLILNFPNYEKNTALPYDFVNNNYWQNLEIIMQKVSGHELNRLLDITLPMPKDQVESYETRIVYRPFHNRIDMGWGLLQMPYYHHQMPHAMRFAILGQKLAEALIDAFDEYGWTIDPKGNNNWDNFTSIEFHKRTLCFYQQISNYLFNDPYKFNNMTTLKYLRNKSLALNIAFDSYLNWLEYQNPHNDHDILSNETLTDVNFSNTQLFFITFAQINCKLNTNNNEQLKHIINSPFNYHTIERYEVNGLLSNFIEFAREFKCPIGGRMNYANKCIMYE